MPVIHLGLVRLVKHIPDHEFFFFLNKYNNVKFSRINDLEIAGKFFDYKFSRYSTYHKDIKTSLNFTSNKNIVSTRNNHPNELFWEEEENKYLLSNMQDVDFIVSSNDEIPDFSLLLPPGNIMFPIQNYSIDAESEIYNIIQYYE